MYRRPCTLSLSSSVQKQKSVVDRAFSDPTATEPDVCELGLLVLLVLTRNMQNFNVLCTINANLYLYQQYSKSECFLYYKCTPLTVFYLCFTAQNSAFLANNNHKQTKEDLSLMELPDVYPSLHHHLTMQFFFHIKASLTFPYVHSL